MEEEQEVKKDLRNLLKGKITFQEYIEGRINWFMSWENVKSFILYLFMLSAGLIMFQIAEKNYENHQECLIGHQAMIMCNGQPAAISCPANYSQSITPALNYSAILPSQESEQSNTSP
jgi:hypothetical protein